MRFVPLAFVAALVSTAASAEPARYIVHFTDMASATAARAPAGDVHGRSGISPRHVRTLATGGELFDLPDGNPAHLAAFSGLAYIEEDIRLQPTAVADPLWRRQWNLHDAKTGVDAEVAWRRTRGAGAVVAVLDTGITPHPEFDGQLLPGFDFVGDADDARDGDGRDPDPLDEGDWKDIGDCGAKTMRRSTWHGTHVAGIVAARSGNFPGMVGLAPEAKVLPVRVMGRCGGRVSDIADAIVWASGGDVPGVPAVTRRADVINLSLGVAGACGLSFSRAIAAARSRGTVVVAAAGNDTVSANAEMPANCPGVVTVAAVARDGGAAWYSNFGERITLAAPGGSLGSRGADDIVSSVDGGERGRERAAYRWLAGTSMAAPHVSALVALMRSVDPSIDVDTVTRQLVDNARPMAGPCPRGCGAGLMDAGATVDAVFEDRARP